MPPIDELTEESPIMKAARFHDRGDIRIEDIPEPVVEPGTVGIEVAWCGICGTDLHEFMEGPIFIPPCGHPHPISGESAPVTMGHEFSGVVYAVGEGSTTSRSASTWWWSPTSWPTMCPRGRVTTTTCPRT